MNLRNVRVPAEEILAAPEIRHQSNDKHLSVAPSRMGLRHRPVPILIAL